MRALFYRVAIWAGWAINMLVLLERRIRHTTASLSWDVLPRRLVSRWVALGSTSRHELTRGVIVRLSGAVLVSAVVTFAFLGSARSEQYCEDIAGTRIGLGEARYRILNGADSHYANAYLDGIGETAIGTFQLLGYVVRIVIPPYIYLSETFNTGVSSFIEDQSASDCKSVTIRYELWIPVSASTCEPALGLSNRIAFHEYKVLTCSLGPSPPDVTDLYQGAKLLEVNNVQLRGSVDPDDMAFFYSIVVDYSGSVVAEDEGCFIVAADSTCAY